MFKKLKRKTAFYAANLYVIQKIQPPFLLNLFTKKDPGLTTVFDKVFDSALGKGFKIKKPEARKVFKRFECLLKIKNRHGKLKEYCTVAQAFLARNIILVFSRARKGKEEDELLLAVLLAHELGHIVDFQTKRVGHPLFDNIRHEDSEMFADAFAAYLFSKLAVLKMRTIFVSPHFNSIRFAQLNLKC